MARSRRSSGQKSSNKGNQNPNWPRKGKPADVPGQSQNKAGRNRGNNPPKEKQK